MVLIFAMIDLVYVKIPKNKGCFQRICVYGDGTCGLRSKNLLKSTWITSWHCNAFTWARSGFSLCFAFFVFQLAQRCRKATAQCPAEVEL